VRSSSCRLVRFAPVVAAVVIAAGMTACSSATGDSAPTKLPAAAESPVASPSPSLTPEAQVEAAVRTYFATVNDAVVSGDTTRLSTLSRPTCQCKAVIDEINAIHAKGHAENARFVVQSVAIKEVQGNTAAAEVEYTVPAYRVLDSQNQVVEQATPFDGHDYVSLVQSQAQWLLDSSFDMNVKDAIR